MNRTPISFSVEYVAQEKLRLECKVCRSTPVSIALCHAHILYVHSTSPEISRVCVYLGVHEHHVSNDVCRKSLDIAYQCVAIEVMKIPIAKNSAIVMATSKKFLTDYLVKISIKW